MGSRISKLIRPQRMRVLILGPDAAGKTTLLYRLKTGRAVNTIPTIGFNVEEIQIKRTIFTIWDVGGQDKIRQFWKHYFIGVGVLAYVVDSSDHERMIEAKEILTNILLDPLLDDCVILVYANKQDMDGADRADEVARWLGLTDLVQRTWHVQPSCAITGDGLYEGLHWAVREERKLRLRLKEKRKMFRYFIDDPHASTELTF
ncbi:unnamed protein product [Clavelina lepadiformis]|uniref:ADP-ribosylation factor n=1 Tax=Clavelina lepadiformis TaxID=159417 RepID=A0ABP0GMX8_CLALP